MYIDCSWIIGYKSTRGRIYMYITHFVDGLQPLAVCRLTTRGGNKRRVEIEQEVTSFASFSIEMSFLVKRRLHSLEFPSTEIDPVYNACSKI